MIYQKQKDMTTQDLSNNRDRIISKIKYQITLCTQQNIVDVMNKMIAMLPQFADQKPTMANIDKLTAKATQNYIKYYKTSTVEQSNAIMVNYEAKQQQSLPSNLQY